MTATGVLHPHYPTPHYQHHANHITNTTIPMLPKARYPHYPTPRLPYVCSSDESDDEQDEEQDDKQDDTSSTSSKKRGKRPMVPKGQGKKISKSVQTVGFIALGDSSDE